MLVAELGRQHHPVAPALDGPADEQLVGERPVHVGSVEEVHPEIQRAVDGREGLVVIAAAVERGHPHASEPEGGYAEAVGAEGAVRQGRHDVLSPLKKRWARRRAGGGGRVIEIDPPGVSRHVAGGAGCPDS